MLQNVERSVDGRSELVVTDHAPLEKRGVECRNNRCRGNRRREPRCWTSGDCAGDDCFGGREVLRFETTCKYRELLNFKLT